MISILCIPTKIHSQTAEKLFGENLSKISLVLQPSLLKGYEVGAGYEGNSPSISFNKDFSAQFGFLYNFYQKNNFNFKAGVIVKTFNPTFNIKISNEDLNAGYDYSEYLSGFEIANQFIFSQTVKTEYFIPINNNLNFAVGLGMSLDIRTGGGDDELSAVVFDYSKQKERIFFNVNSTEQQVTGSLDVSLGVNYKTNIGLFQIELFNNSQLLSYPKTGVYEFYLDNNQTKTGVYTIKGNYNGLALIFTPRKGWLKRN
ncbi:hypothetical protein H9W95_08690 [Flavobacterium lindanitolerans]|nr:hypothetical protein [Flavobacterium lindanitolerans]